MFLELIVAAVATFAPPEPAIPLGALPNSGRACLIDICDAQPCTLLVAPRGAKRPTTPRCGRRSPVRPAPHVVPITD